MREIIFRGKRTYDGQWITGWLIELGRQSFSDNRRFGIANKAVSLGNSSVCYNLKIDEVIPETVGQYTGLADKNGKKIFEGDIVRLVYNGNEHIYQVVYDVTELDFKATNGREEYGNNFQYPTCCEEVEVIGNINDNPELLSKSNK